MTGVSDYDINKNVLLGLKQGMSCINYRERRTKSHMNNSGSSQ